MTRFREYGQPKRKRQVHLPTVGTRIEVVQKARLAMLGGFAFPCAMCTKLHRMMDRGLLKCEEAVQEGGDCAGPLDGKSFPLYEGPLDREAIASHCIRCGKPQGVDGKGFLRHEAADGGTVGLCAYHKPLVDDPGGGYGRLVPDKIVR